MAAPVAGRQLKFSDGRGSGAQFDIRSTAPKLRGVVFDEDDPTGVATRAFFRMYDRDGRYMWSEEATRISSAGGGTWEFQTTYNASGDSAVFELTFAGTPTAGSFRINFNGEWSNNIGFTDTPSRKATILGGHPDVGPGNVEFSTYNSTTKKMTVTLIRSRSHLKFVELYAVSSNLVGAGAGVSISRVTAGQGHFSSYPSFQGQYFFDLVAYAGGRWSGDIAGSNPRAAIGGERCELWSDVPVGIASTIPASGGTVTSTSFTFYYTYTAGTILQVGLRDVVLDIFDPNGSTVWSGRDEAGSRGSMGIPYGYLQNATAYTWQLTATKLSGLVTVATGSFTVSVTRPAAVSYTATVHGSAAYIDTTHAVFGSSADFLEYYFKVRPEGEPESSNKNVKIWNSTDRLNTFARLYRFPRNRSIILSFYVRQMAGGVEVDSLAYERTIFVPLDSVILVNPISGTQWVILDGHDGREDNWVGKPNFIMPWPTTANGTPPVAVVGGSKYRVFSMTALLDDPVMENNIAKYNQLVDFYLNARNTPIIYANAFGEWYEMLLDEPGRATPGGGESLEVDVAGTEVRALYRSIG